MATSTSAQNSNSASKSAQASGNKMAAVAVAGREPEALALVIGKTGMVPLLAGQSNKIKVQPGQHFKLVKDKAELSVKEAADNVIAKQQGEDLLLQYEGGTTLTLEGFYAVCKDAATCSVQLPSDTAEGYTISGDTARGATLGDGSTLVYAHGGHDALLSMAQGQDGLQQALMALGGSPILTYMPHASLLAADTGFGTGALAILGLGVAAGAGGGGGAAAAAAVVAAVVAPVIPDEVIATLTTTLSGAIVAGAVSVGNGLTVEAYTADGTLLGTAKVKDDGSYSLSYTVEYSGPVLLKVTDADAGSDYQDEATHAAKDIDSTLYAVISDVMAGKASLANITALTDLAARKIGLDTLNNSLSSSDEAAIIEINQAIAKLFGLSSSGEQIIALGAVPVWDSVGGDQIAVSNLYGRILASISGAELHSGQTTTDVLDLLLFGLTITGGSAHWTNDAAGDAAKSLFVEGVSRALQSGAITEPIARTILQAALTESSDHTPTVLVYTSKVSLNVGGGDSTVYFKLSEASSDFDVSDITVTGGTLSGFVQDAVDPTLYIATFTPSSVNSLFATVSVAAGAFSNAASVLNLASAELRLNGDTLAPTVDAVDITGVSGVPINTANAGDQLSITVNMSEATFVTGVPTLALNIGGTIVQANYVSGSGTAALVFTYTVLAGQNDSDGISIDANSLSGVLKDAKGNAATVVHASVADNPSYLVDTIAPVFTSPILVNDVVAGSGGHQIVYTAGATDAGTINFYSLKSTGDYALLSIDQGTGAVTLVDNPSLAKLNYNFTVVAHDQANNERELSLSFAVVLAPDTTPPVITSGDAAVSINENSGIGQVVYTAAATDAGSISYSLKSGVGDAAKFSINASTGAVTLTGNPDYETQLNYTFTVVAEDVAHNVSEKIVTLAVNDLDEVPPVFTSAGTAASINENSGASQAVYIATATDAGGGAIAYSLKAGVGDAGKFSINSSTGAVTLTGSPDYETQAGYTFTVVAQDAAHNAVEQVVTLAINDLDEVPPAFTSNGTAPSIDENSGAGQLVYTAVATDAGAVTYSLKSTGDHASFTINETTGAVTLTGSPDYETHAAYTFTVVAEDAAHNTSEKVVTLAINNLDDTPPTVTNAAALDGVTNLSVSDDLVLTFGAPITALSGGVIKIVNDANAGSKLGYQVESTDHSINLYLKTSTSTLDGTVRTIHAYQDAAFTVLSGSVSVDEATGLVTINPLFDLDISNNYHIEVGADTFDKTSTGANNLEFGALSGGQYAMNFSTVTPGNADGPTGSLAAAAASVKMTANGAGTAAGQFWISLDVASLGADGALKNLDLSGKDYALVMKNLAASGFTELGVQTSNYFALNSFAVGDKLYFDDQNNAGVFDVADALSGGYVGEGYNGSLMYATALPISMGSAYVGAFAIVGEGIEADVTALVGGGRVVIA